METVMRSLPVKLTDEEKKDRGQLMAQQVQAIKRLELELAAIKAEFKGKLQAANTAISLYSDTVANGVEYREVECEQVPDRVEGVVRIKRLDIGEVVAVRTMTRTEMNEAMRTRE